MLIAFYLALIVASSCAHVEDDHETANLEFSDDYRRMTTTLPVNTDVALILRLDRTLYFASKYPYGIEFVFAGKLYGEIGSTCYTAPR